MLIFVDCPVIICGVIMNRHSVWHITQGVAWVIVIYIEIIENDKMTWLRTLMARRMKIKY